MRYDSSKLLDPRLLEYAPVSTVVMLDGVIYQKTGSDSWTPQGPAGRSTPERILAAIEEYESIGGMYPVYVWGVHWMYCMQEKWQTMPIGDFPYIHPDDVLNNAQSGELVLINGHPCQCVRDTDSNEVSWWARSQWVPQVGLEPMALARVLPDTDVTDALRYMILHPETEQHININGRDWTFTGRTSGRRQGAMQRWRDAYELIRMDEYNGDFF